MDGCALIAAAGRIERYEVEADAIMNLTAYQSFWLVTIIWIFSMVVFEIWKAPVSGMATIWIGIAWLYCGLVGYLGDVLK